MRQTRHHQSLTRRILNWFTPVKAFFLIAVLSVCALGAYKFAKSWYLNFREVKLVENASENINKENFSEAALSAKRALQLNNQSIPATQSMAFLAEKLNVPDAILWRTRVTELSPNDPASQSALAATAIHFGQISRAKAALEGIPASGQGSVGFHELSAMVAFGEGRTDDAINHFSEALKLEPNDINKKFNLAKSQLFSIKENTRADAVQTLELVANDENLGSDALRLLIQNAIRFGNHATALDYAFQMESRKSATLEDLLIAAQVRLINFGTLILPPDLQGTLNLRLARYPAFLKRIKKIALEDDEKFLLALQWMYRNGLSQHAIQWTRGELLLYQVADPRVQVAIGEAYIQLKDWEGLLNWTQRPSADWEYFEYYRHAFYAKSLVELGMNYPESDEIHRIWLAALESTSNDRLSLELLANRANSWSWEPLSVETYWTMVNNAADPTVGLQVLFRYYAKNKNTYGLWRITDRLIRTNPDDDILSNNLAQLSMLLKTQLRRALDISSKLHEKYKNKPDYGSTYAFGLLVEKRYRSALRVMREYAVSKLSEPNVALYAGLTFYANDLKSEADEMFALAKQGQGDFLPEEVALLKDPSLIMNWIDTPPIIQADELKSIEVGK